MALGGLDKRGHIYSKHNPGTADYAPHSCNPHAPSIYHNQSRYFCTPPVAPCRPVVSECPSSASDPRTLL